MSEYKCYVLKNLKKNFLHLEKASGYIGGWTEDENFFCTSIAASPDMFLMGIDVIGCFQQLSKECLSDVELFDISKKLLNDLKIESENPLVLFVHKQIDTENSIVIDAVLYLTYGAAIQHLDVSDIDDIPFVLLNARGKFPLLIEVSADTDIFKENIESVIERLKCAAHKDVPAFVLHDTDIILHRNSDRELTYSDMTCRDFVKHLQKMDVVSQIQSTKKKHSKFKIQALKFEIFMSSSGEIVLQNTVNHTLVIHCQRRNFQCLSVNLPVDVLVVARESCSLREAYELLVQAVLQQLDQMNRCLLTYAEKLDYVCPVPYHFYPESMDFPVTVIYPLSKTDKDLENYRRKLHNQLMLSTNRPMLRKLNVWSFSDVTPTGCLINPHIGLGPSGVQGGKLAIVHGRYSYHHYMQDRMDDNGWGCAYRSLQTIISWFKFQGYTDKLIPTHKEIQQALVDVGDKPSSFVGSKKWIGSQEVCFCLDKLIQVKSKIMFVSNGAEIGTKCRELYAHFQTEGTPIMIGGGVLAHTILGVDFNPDNGEYKLLILDPHYTGGEDINVIQNKGWCGWKPARFWDQTAFYNLCLPQCSQEI